MALPAASPAPSGSYGEREYENESIAGTFAADESITDVAARLGWTVISMANDWDTIFAD